jgi:hypothetical protein
MPHYPGTETFAPAPTGPRVRLTTSLVAGLAAVILIVDLCVYLGWGDPARQHFILAGPLVGLLVLGIWLGARIRAYRLEGGTLVVERLLHSPRIALDGLVAVEPERDAMAGAIKTFGNGGLGAISGRFRNRKHGPFRAYVTSLDHCVVLRWPDRRAVVLSPARVYPFLAAVRARTGLKS